MPLLYDDKNCTTGQIAQVVTAQGQKFPALDIFMPAIPPAEKAGVGTGFTDAMADLSFIRQDYYGFAAASGPSQPGLTPAPRNVVKKIFRAFPPEIESIGESGKRSKLLVVEQIDTNGFSINASTLS